MKKLLIIAVAAANALCYTGCKKDDDASNVAPINNGNQGTNNPGNGNNGNNGQNVPDALIAPGGQYWTLGTISSINFWDEGSTEYRNAGGVVVFFKFNKDATYKFLLYVNSSTATTRDQTWTEVEGTFEIGEAVLSDGNTYKTIQLKPIKGTDKILTSTRNTTNSISAEDLRTRGSLSGKFAFSRYQKDGKQFLDMLNMKTNEISSFHEEN